MGSQPRLLATTGVVSKVAAISPRNSSLSLVIGFSTGCKKPTIFGFTIGNVYGCRPFKGTLPRVRSTRCDFNDSASIASIGSAARWRRDARRCRRTCRIGRRHHARICKAHRHALAACGRIRCRYYCEVRIDAGVAKLGDNWLNCSARRAARYFDGRERQCRAIGRRTSRDKATCDGR